VLPDPDAQDRLAAIFGNEGTDEQKLRANNFLAQNWPRYTDILHPQCQQSISEFCCIMPSYGMFIPKEVIELIVKTLIRVWPQPHFVKQENNIT